MEVDDSFLSHFKPVVTVDKDFYNDFGDLFADPYVDEEALVDGGNEKAVVDGGNDKAVVDEGNEKAVVDGGNEKPVNGEVNEMDVDEGNEKV